MNDILPDVLDNGLALVFCGTAPSRVSARAGAYYANPSNAFWSTLFATGITPRLFSPREFRRLLDLKIGLTDVAKGAIGVDSQLRRSDFHPQQLRQKIICYQPRVVAFTSKTAWRAWMQLPQARAVSYGWQDAHQDSSRFFVLPSPSGAARRYWSITPWQQLAHYHARLVDTLWDS